MPSKRKRQRHSQRILDALKIVDKEIIDKRHNLKIYLVNDSARSNESRFEHIAKTSHFLSVKDIENLVEDIKTKSVLKKDKERKDRYNYYFRRRSSSIEYIKVNVEVDIITRKAFIKTIFITKRIK